MQSRTSRLRYAQALIDINVIEAVTTPIGASQFGQISSGLLRAQCRPLVPIEIRSAAKTLSILGSIDSYNYMDFPYRPDCTFSVDESTTYYCMQVAHGFDSFKKIRTIAGLVLEATDGVVFKRIGCYEVNEWDGFRSVPKLYKAREIGCAGFSEGPREVCCGWI